MLDLYIALMLIAIIFLIVGILIGQHSGYRERDAQVKNRIRALTYYINPYTAFNLKQAIEELAADVTESRLRARFRLPKVFDDSASDQDHL